MYSHVKLRVCYCTSHVVNLARLPRQFLVGILITLRFTVTRFQMSDVGSCYVDKCKVHMLLAPMFLYAYGGAFNEIKTSQYAVWLAGTQSKNNLEQCEFRVLRLIAHCLCVHLSQGTCLATFRPTRALETLVCDRTTRTLPLCPRVKAGDS